MLQFRTSSTKTFSLTEKIDDHVAYFLYVHIYESLKRIARHIQVMPQKLEETILQNTSSKKLLEDVIFHV